MKNITEENIKNIINKKGKIRRRELKVSGMDFNSIIFLTEENLFKYMVDNNIIFESANILSVCNKCSNETSFSNIIDGYKCLCKRCQHKQTCLEKYGDENYNNMNKSLQTKIDNDSYSKMVETHKQTCLEKYGVEHHWLVEEIQDKKKNNFVEKYGVDNPMKVKEIQDKAKVTCLEKYGVENPSYNREIKDKIRDAQLNLTEDEKKIKESKRKIACLDKYGFEHQMQTGLYDYSGFKWKEYITPNNHIWKVQGYEPFLLDELFLEYKEDEIITSRKDMPQIWYIGTDNKEHRYFPDAYVPSTNTIYEVKSSWTLSINPEINELKFQAVKDAGYNFVLKVY